MTPVDPCDADQIAIVLQATGARAVVSNPPYSADERGWLTVGYLAGKMPVSDATIIAYVKRVGIDRVFDALDRLATPTAE
jgi:hypothetical protein